MARRFDATDGRLRGFGFPPIPAFGDFTVMLWGIAFSEGESDTGFYFSAVDPFQLHFWTGTNQPRFFYSFGTSRSVIGSNNDFILNKWQHWTARFQASNTTCELIVDGSRIVASNSADPGTTAHQDGFFVGAGDSGGAGAFDGDLADCRVYTSRFTLGEIRKAMRGDLVHPEHLYHHWPLKVEGSVDEQARDVTQRQHHFDVLGSVQFADDPPLLKSGRQSEVNDRKYPHGALPIRKRFVVMTEGWRRGGSLNG